MINVYDLSKNSEDDALTESLNTESSVDSLYWFEYNNSAVIAATTHTMECQLWKQDAAEPYANFNRGSIADGIKVGNATFSMIIE